MRPRRAASAPLAGPQSLVPRRRRPSPTRAIPRDDVDARLRLIENPSSILVSPPLRDECEDFETAAQTSATRTGGERQLLVSLLCLRSSCFLVGSALLCLHRSLRLAKSALLCLRPRPLSRDQGREKSSRQRRKTRLFLNVSPSLLVASGFIFSLSLLCSKMCSTGKPKQRFLVARFTHARHAKSVAGRCTAGATCSE